MKEEALTLFVALSIVACSSSRHTHEQGSIVGTWIIERAIDTSTEGADQEPFITFSADGRMNGNASVNSFFGNYTSSQARLHIDNVGMTRRLGASMQVEQAITEAINRLAAASVSGQRAYLFSEEGDTLLWLRRKE